MANSIDLLGPQLEVTALLGQGCSFEGRLIFEGIVRIDGKFTGDIFTRDSLIIGPDAKVVAQIEADKVVVSGYLEGHIRASSRVEIQSTGHVKSMVTSPILKIEEGGVFDGNTQMMVSSERTEANP
jgi:cytoskeletal protein CcmA (bactofilin family)